MLRRRHRDCGSCAPVRPEHIPWVWEELAPVPDTYPHANPLTPLPPPHPPPSPPLLAADGA